MKNQIAKHTASNLTKHTAPHAKPITVKHVMVLDTNDGAFIDASVKVKPHKTDDRKLVLKCTDGKRLLNAAKQMGLTLCGPMQKGAKHWIAFCWKQQFGAALLAQQGMSGGMLSTPSTASLKGAPAYTLTGKKGGK